MTELLRRDLIVGSATAPLGAYGNATELGTPGFLSHAKGEYPIGTITTNDGSTIFYKDWARPTHCVQPRLATVVGRLGRPDVVLRAKGVSRHCT